MIIKNEIKEGNVAQGDLVFIYHHTKPMKTGWWRKIREGDSDNKKVNYILEKPMHKDFDINKLIDNCHVENDLCIMSSNWVKNDPRKYEIMADIRGVMNIRLVNSNYSLEAVYFGSKIQKPVEKENVYITKRFDELKNLYSAKREKVNDLQVLVGGLV